MKITEELNLIDIDELIPYANNARTHSKDQINKLRSSLRYLIKDALDGNIDLIITKSVSRFARNMVDTLMSSLAQEGSRSISENVTWGHRKRFSDGKVSLPYGQ